MRKIGSWVWWKYEQQERPGPRPSSEHPKDIHARWHRFVGAFFINLPSGSWFQGNPPPFTQNQKEAAVFWGGGGGFLGVNGKTVLGEGAAKADLWRKKCMQGQVHLFPGGVVSRGPDRHLLKSKRGWRSTPVLCFGKGERTYGCAV